MNNRTPIVQTTLDAAWVQQEVDIRIGRYITRFLSLTVRQAGLGARFERMRIRWGTQQGVLLAAICSKFFEYENYAANTEFSIGGRQFFLFFFNLS